MFTIFYGVSIGPLSKILAVKKLIEMKQSLNLIG